MALQMAAFLQGKMDNVVFYKRLGTYIARARPAQVKQSAATKVRSRNFGIAARAGKALRQSLLPALPFSKDKLMQSRFSGAIAQWLQLQSPESMAPATAIPCVSNFCFNESTSVAERWKIPFNITQPAADVLEWEIPSFIPTVSIAAPAHTETVVCTVAAGCCGLADGAATGHFNFSFPIAYTDSLQDAMHITMPVPTAAGTLIVTAVSLTYLLSNGQTETRQSFLPSSVIDARYC